MRKRATKLCGNIIDESSVSSLECINRKDVVIFDSDQTNSMDSHDRISVVMFNSEMTDPIDGDDGWPSDNELFNSEITEPDESDDEHYSIESESDSEPLKQPCMAAKKSNLAPIQQKTLTLRNSQNHLLKVATSKTWMKVRCLSI